MALPVPMAVAIGPVLGALFSAAFLRQYAVRDVNKVAFLASVSGCTLTFSIITLVPYDVWQALIDSKEPRWIGAGWDVLYWITSLLCWILCPVLIEFEASGDFTPKDRLRASVRRNLLWYTIYAGVGVIVFLGIIFSGTIQGSIGAWCITASNTWGILWLTLLMGFGLVAIPKHLWEAADPARQLPALYKIAAARDEARLSAQFELQDVMSTIRAQYPGTGEHGSDMSHAFNSLGRTMAQCEALLSDLTQHRGVSRVTSGHSLDSPRGAPGRAPLVDQRAILRELSQLHFSLKQAGLEARRTACIWNEFVQKCIFLEDLLSQEYHAAAELLVDSFGTGRCARALCGSDAAKACWRSAAVLWLSNVRPRFLRTWAVICGILSVTIVMGQLTMFSTSRSWSLLALLLRSQHGFGFTLVFCAVPLGYMATTAFWSIFRLKIAGFYGLYPSQNTDTGSLLWCASLTARLAAPLCYHFLLLCRIENTAFQRLMGQMNLVPFVGDSFNQVFPVIIGLVCVSNMFNLCSKVLSCLGFASLELEWGSPTDDVSEGKRLMERERPRRDERRLEMQRQ